MEKTEEVEIPIRAMQLTSTEVSGQVEESSVGEKKDTRAKFRMVANSGGVIQHPYWGNFAIDLSGLKVGRKKKPALRDHDSQKIVGWTDSFEKTDEGLIAEGTFTEATEDGREVLSMLRDGFPWQASVYVPPKKVQRLAEGETAEVNGHQISGPGHIFRESSLREVTFTALGADENTDAAQLSSGSAKVTAHFFSSEQKEMEVQVDQQEAKQEEAALSAPLDAETTVSDEAETSIEDRFSNGYDSGVKSERERITAILSHALDHQQALASDLIESGVESSEAFSALLKDAKGQVETRLAHLSEVTPTPVGIVEEESPETDLQAAFNADPKISAEFGTFEVYEAYMTADDLGAIRGRSQ